MCVNGQHLGLSSGEVLGLSEAWPLCLPCCPLCWPGSLELSPGPVRLTSWKLVLSLPPSFLSLGLDAASFLPLLPLVLC